MVRLLRRSPNEHRLSGAGVVVRSLIRHADVVNETSLTARSSEGVMSCGIFASFAPAAIAAVTALRLDVVVTARPAPAPPGMTACSPASIVALIEAATSTAPKARPYRGFLTSKDQLRTGWSTR